MGSKSFGLGHLSLLRIYAAHELNRNTQTVNSVATCWHQWSKKVRAHPAPLICSSLSDNTLPLSLPSSLNPFLSFSFPPDTQLFLFIQSHICLICQPHSPLFLFSLLPLCGLSPPFSANVWCPPSDQLQFGRAGESDIIITGQERDSRPLPAPNTFQEMEGKLGVKPTGRDCMECIYYLFVSAKLC